MEDLGRPPRHVSTYDSVFDLHRRTVDVLVGYETMLDKAVPEFRPTLLRFIDLHHDHAGQLAGILTDAGHEPDPDGTLMGTINKTVVSLRALVDAIDADLLPQIHDGEAHVLEAMDLVLENGAADPGFPSDNLQAVDEMRRGLRSLLDQTRPTR